MTVMLGVDHFFGSFQEVIQMGKPHRKSGQFTTLGKPNGIVMSRVKAVGPEHFGIVCVDPHKGSSVWSLCDFYGNVLVPPSELIHSQGDFQAACDLIRQTMAQRQLKDLIISIERTGRYHHPVQNAFKNAGFEVRILHPYTTKQYRQPANQGNKTDATDLAAMHRASVNGFGLLELSLDPIHQQLRLLVRHRRDCVEKRTMLCCQMLDYLALFMPGFDQCFDNFWTSQAALWFPQHLCSPAEILNKDPHALGQLLREAHIGFQNRTLDKIHAWARSAPAPDPQALLHHRIWCDLLQDYLLKTKLIRSLEIEIASCLVQTPYILLISVPGINVVSAAEFGGEMGPISHYANPRAITGRAGLYPSRYNSNQVDLKDGPLVRCAFRRLRAAIMIIADNLCTCNNHFKALALGWKTLGKNPKHTRVKIASRFCRIAFHMVAGQQVFQHPSFREHDYVLHKLYEFHRDHDTSFNSIRVDLQAALSWLPKNQYATEATPLVELQKKHSRRRSSEPVPIADVFSSVLADLTVQAVQKSAVSEDLVPR